MPTEQVPSRDVRAERSGIDLLVLGDCHPDLVLAGGTISPELGQVERLIDGADLTIGGSAGITACGAARLGLRTAVVGVVGDDVFGRFMLGALSERGVDTRGVVVDPAARTGLRVIFNRPVDRAILTFPGTVSALTADHVGQDMLACARHIHVAAFFLQAALVSGLPKLFERAHAAGATTSIDPHSDRHEQWDGGLEHLLGQTDVFLPNAEEAMRIADVANTGEAACALAARGTLVAVKLGERGALAARASGELVEIEALRGTARVDTIGAGDSFDAGFLTALLDGWSTRWALALGSACGSLSTRATGGTPAQPMLAEAEEAVAALLEAR